jgi:hypothetical protein
MQMNSSRKILTLPKKQNRFIEIDVTIVYDPFRPGLRKNNRSNLIVGELDFGFSEFYQHLIKKGTGKIIQGNAWKPHVTIFDGKKSLSEEAKKLWKKHHGKTVKIRYSVDVEKHWKFWVIPVECEFFKQIREELGLKGSFPFHITVGRDF